MKRTLFALVLMACAGGIALAQKPAAPAAPAPEPTKPAAVIAPVPDSPGQSMIESDEIPSDSARKLVSTRCRRTGCASARMSS